MDRKCSEANNLQDLVDFFNQHFTARLINEIRRFSIDETMWESNHRFTLRFRQRRPGQVYCENLANKLQQTDISDLLFKAQNFDDFYSKISDLCLSGREQEFRVHTSTDVIILDIAKRLWMNRVDFGQNLYLNGKRVRDVVTNTLGFTEYKKEEKIDRSKLNERYSALRGLRTTYDLWEFFYEMKEDIEHIFENN
ncbi:MAG: hypothetical protein MJZ20_13250 [Bacteroidaceae bacterium]|nr:hypothetical protein [Bacteroidaceae bacterium]